MQASFDIHREQGTLIISASGSWERQSLSGSSVSAAPLMDAALKALAEPGLQSVAFHAPELESWDSLLLASFNAVAREAAKRGLAVDSGALPAGMGPMLDMALAVPPSDQARTQHDEGFLEFLSNKVSLENIADVNAVYRLLAQKTV